MYLGPSTCSMPLRPAFSHKATNIQFNTKRHDPCSSVSVTTTGVDGAIEYDSIAPPNRRLALGTMTPIHTMVYIKIGGAHHQPCQSSVSLCRPVRTQLSASRACEHTATSLEGHPRTVRMITSWWRHTHLQTTTPQRCRGKSTQRTVPIIHSSLARGSTIEAIALAPILERTVLLAQAINHTRQSQS